MNRHAVASADHLQPTSVHALQDGPDLIAEQQATRDHLELEGRSDRQPLIQLKHRLFTEPELVNGRSQFEAAVLIRTTQRINLERSNPHRAEHPSTGRRQRQLVVIINNDQCGIQGIPQIDRSISPESNRRGGIDI